MHLRVVNWSRNLQAKNSAGKTVDRMVSTMNFNILGEILQDEENNLIFSDIENEICDQPAAILDANVEDPPSKPSTNNEMDSEKSTPKRITLENDSNVLTSNVSFTKRDDRFSASHPMFLKAELNCDLNKLRFKGKPVDREKATTFRAGDEVFIDSAKRSQARNKTFIIFGIFPSDRAHPELSWILVIDENATPRDETNLLGVFRSVPLQYVGLVPSGKCADETLDLLEELIPLCKRLFETFLSSPQLKSSGKSKVSNHPLSLLDFSAMSTSKESFSRHYGSITRKKKTNVHSQSQHSPTSALQALTEQHLLSSPQQPSGVLISGTATPPFAKRLEKKVAFLTGVCTSLQKKDASQLSKVVAQNKKMNARCEELLQENKGLKAELADAAALAADNVLCNEEIQRLKQALENSEAADSAKATEIEQLK
jgi:hypothetical protein